MPALVALVCALPAQNLVKNGDFELGLNSWTPNAMPADARIEVFDVTGGGSPSRCYAWTPHARGQNIHQNLPPLKIGTDYTLTADVAIVWPARFVPPKTMVTSAFVLRVFGTPTAHEWHSLAGNAGQVDRFQLTNVGTAFPAPFFHSLIVSADVGHQGVPGTTPRIYVDNVIFRESAKVKMWIQGRRDLRTPFLKLFVKGTGGLWNITFASAGLLPFKLKLSQYSGLWQLDPSLTLALKYQRLNFNGEGSVRLYPLPNLAAGIKFHFQSIQFDLSGWGDISLPHYMTINR